MTGSRRVFRALLVILPGNWKRRWTDETVDAFGAHLDDARAIGLAAVIRVWGRGVWDILRWSVMLRLRPSHGRAPMSRPRLGWTGSDLKYAWRVYRRRPLQTGVMLLTIGGAIGICATVFSAVNSILLTPLPFPDPERMVTIRQSYPNAPGFGTLSWANFHDLETGVPAFEAVGVAVGTRNAVRVTGLSPFYAQTYHVNEDFHRVTGISPIIGRLATLSADGPLESLIGEALWNREFSRDPDVLGRLLDVNNTNTVIVGVLPAGAGLPRGADVVTVADLERWWGPGRTLGGLNGFARLQPDATLETARQQAIALAAAISAEFGSEVGSEFRFRIEGLHQDLTSNARETLILLACAVAAVFLITCINIAAISTTQYMARRREMALRASLGAGRVRIAWQLLTESLVLALAGAGLGVALAWFLAGPLNSLLPQSYLRSGPVRPDGRVVAVGIALAIAAGVLSAAIPLLRAWRGPEFQTLRTAGGHDTPTGRSGLSPRALLVPQYVVSLATLAVTGLLIRTLLSLADVDPGFAASGRIAIETDVPDARSEESAEYQRQLAETIARVPGVTGVAFAFSLPIIETSSIAAELQTDTDAPDVFPVNALWRTVSASYFDVMSISVLTGRGFAERGTPLGGVVISRTLADRLGGAETVLGTQIRPRLQTIAGSDERRWLEVIGVVGDLRDMGMQADPWPVVYTLNSQNPSWARYADMVVRVERSPAAAAREIVAAAQSFDSQLPIGTVRTFEEAVNANLHPQRFRAGVLSGFGIAALVLVTLGMYGSTAQTVQRRRRELAIRTALGAAPANLVRLSVRDALFTILIGTAVGLGVAWVGGRLVENMLFGVGSTDPTVMALVVVTVAAAVMLASWLPARRAARIDPADVLRGD